MLSCNKTAETEVNQTRWCTAGMPVLVKQRQEEQEFKVGAGDVTQLVEPAQNPEFHS